MFNWTKSHAVFLLWKLIYNVQQMEANVYSTVALERVLFMIISFSNLILLY